MSTRGSLFLESHQCNAEAAPDSARRAMCIVTTDRSRMSFRFISPRMHGFLDHFMTITLMAVPRMLGWSDKVQRLNDALAITAAAYSSMTDYDLAMIRVIPMQAHLAVDAAMGGFLLITATTRGRRDRSERYGLAAFGLFSIFAALTTRPRDGAKSTPTTAGPDRSNLEPATFQGRG
jgi:type II secretory pathway pseudopilin PulG